MFIYLILNPIFVFASSFSYYCDICINKYALRLIKWKNFYSKIYFFKNYESQFSHFLSLFETMLRVFRYNLSRFNFFSLKDEKFFFPIFNAPLK
jgi:hypothetical protein